jgi:hypothetical protein
MDSVSVSLDDIDALAQALDAGTLPAEDLLNSLVTAIRTAVRDEESVTVSVQVEGSLPETFQAAFEPEPAPQAPGTGQQYHMYLKIGR